MAAAKLLLPILAVWLACATTGSLAAAEHRTLFVNSDENDQRSVQKRNTVTFHAGDEEATGFRTMEDYVQLHQRMRRDTAAAAPAPPPPQPAIPTNSSGSGSSSTTKVPPLEDEKKKIIPKVTYFDSSLLQLCSTLLVRYKLFAKRLDRSFSHPSHRQPAQHIVH